MQVISRQQAITQSLSRYFTGEPCKYGHITYRYTKNGGCADCVNPKFEVAEREPSVSFMDLRHAAAARGELRYSTGRPCRRGHLSDRYVSTGVCVECLHPRSADGRSERRLQRDALRARMALQGFVIHPSDYEAFEATALFYARLREPSLTAADLRSKSKPPHYILWIFPDDRAALQDMECSLRAHRNLDRAGSGCTHRWAEVPGTKGLMLYCTKCHIRVETKE